MAAGPAAQSSHSHPYDISEPRVLMVAPSGPMSSERSSIFSSRAANRWPHSCITAAVREGSDTPGRLECDHYQYQYCRQKPDLQKSVPHIFLPRGAPRC